VTIPVPVTRRFRVPLHQGATGKFIRFTHNLFAPASTLFFLSFLAEAIARVCDREILMDQLDADVRPVVSKY